MTDVNELLEAGKQINGFKSLLKCPLVNESYPYTNLFKISTPTLSTTSNPTIILYFCPQKIITY